MSVKFEDNSVAVLRLFEQNIDKTLHMLGTKQNELAVKEINAQPRMGKLEGAAGGAVDTGRMRGSNTFFVDAAQREIDVGNTAFSDQGAPYPLYVTMGTWKMQKRSWLQNSVLDHADDYRAVVEQGLQQGFK